MPDSSLPEGNPSFFQRIRFWLEYRIMLDMVGQDGPGPLFRWIFKSPIPMYHLGLWHLAGPFIMLVHKGRKTGKTRHTPLEYTYEPETDSYLLMAGWRGHTDWYRNVRADPHVHAQVGRRAFDAVAEPMNDDEAARLLKQILVASPASAKMLHRWSDAPLDPDSPESLLRAAKDFPCVRLKPVSKNAT
jgi:deazaflavin-dependent oxidoreductase (nitroreductase family)